METPNTTRAEAGEFSLHALATQIVRTHESVDPTELAHELIGLIDSEHFDSAVRTMAREYVRTVIGSERRAATAATAATPRTATGSRRVAAARDQWQRLIDVPEYVPSLASWVRLREATQSQVREMAAHRTHQASKNVAAAKRYEKIARSMRSLGAATVGDLPADALRSVFETKRDAA